MSGSDRSLVAPAIFGLVAISAGMGCWWTASYYEQPYTYPSYRYASDEALKAATGQPSQVQIDPAKYKRPCGDPHGHDETDLCAQWRAAKAAEHAALWGFAQMLLSAFGVVGLAITLWYNRNALKIAREANVVSQRNGEAQIKCYLSITGAWVRLSNNVLTVQVTVKNSGQSPALMAMFDYGVTFNSADHAKPISTGWYESIAVGERYEAVIWTYPTHLAERHAALWGESSKCFVGLSVKINAKDVFGKPVECIAVYMGIPRAWDDGEPHELTDLLTMSSVSEADRLRRSLLRTANDDSRHREG